MDHPLLFQVVIHFGKFYYFVIDENSLLQMALLEHLNLTYLLRLRLHPQPVAQAVLCDLNNSLLAWFRDQLQLNLPDFLRYSLECLG